MNPRHWTLLIAVAGIALVAMSAVWPRVAPGRTWSEEKAVEHAQAAARVHYLAHERAHGNEQGTHQHAANAFCDVATIEAAQQRYEQTAAELDRARNAGRGLAAMLRWLGIGCVLVGGGGFLALRAMEPR